jgi:N-formylglutamate amidohydrolase
VQLELSQITYMDEDPPFAFREDLAANIRPVLRRLLETALDWAASLAGR